MPAPVNVVVEFLRALVLLLSEGDGSSLRKIVSELPREEAVHKVTEAEREILDLLGRAERPLKGRTVAARLGRSYSSHLRETLADMVRRGQLARGPKGGYWPAGKPPPACDLDD